MRFSPLLLLLFASAICAETGYRYVHPDGTVEYSDTPIKGGEEINLQEAPTIKFEPVSPSATSQGGTPRGKQGSGNGDNAGIAITYPQADQTIWFDGSGMSVSIAVSSPLMEGEVIHLSLDGQLVGSGTGSRYNIGVVARGTHTLRATVVGAGGAMIRSSTPVTFYMRQHSLVEPKRNTPVAPSGSEPILP